MTNRNSRIAVTEKELDRLKDAKRVLYGPAADDVAHGTAIMRLISEYEADG
jgi:hypothetical protein